MVLKAKDKLIKSLTNVLRCRYERSMSSFILDFSFVIFDLRAIFDAIFKVALLCLWNHGFDTH